VNGSCEIGSRTVIILSRCEGFAQFRPDDEVGKERSSKSCRGHLNRYISINQSINQSIIEDTTFSIDLLVLSLHGI
jgi:hypothetical protein